MSGSEYDEDDFLDVFKVITVGDSGVGKTNLISRFTKNEFDLETRATMGVEVASKFVTLKDNRKIKAEIWDTAGQERYRSITTTYYRGADGAIIVYDMTNVKSFKNIEYWINEIKNEAGDDASILIVGNKSDLKNLYEVPAEMSAKLAINYQLKIIETSALESTNVEEAFTKLLRNINKRKMGKNDDGELDQPKKDNNTVEPKNKEQAVDIEKSCCFSL